LGCQKLATEAQARVTTLRGQLDVANGSVTSLQGQLAQAHSGLAGAIGTVTTNFRDTVAPR
jgi:hypothetical protein